MNLIIDIGNTRTKMATFRDNSMVAQLSDENSQYDRLIPFIQENCPCTACIISAVAPMPRWLTDELKQIEMNPLLLESTTLLPFKNSYQSKETLGYDRIAAVAGACALYPSKNVLIIDAGTALTFDLKTEREEYVGGNISPGLTMRFRSLHEYTSRLPYLEPGETMAPLGNTTAEAIRNGVQLGIAWETEQYIEWLSNKYNGLIVLLTGGDSQFFENLLKKTIFVVSNLTLIGLNYILQHNAKDK
jgi:type III pantothenate kinase